MNRVPVGLMSLSSNDIYGPRGAGALYVRKGVQVAPVMMGGGQERGLRSGTEDVAALQGMAAAADIMAAEQAAETERIRNIRDELVERVLGQIPDSHLNGHPNGRLVNNAHFRFDDQTVPLLQNKEALLRPGVLQHDLHHPFQESWQHDFDGKGL